jgi:hypothetical protein
MNFAAEQIQIASLISKRVQELNAAGLDDVTLFGEMADYLPDLKRLIRVRETKWMASPSPFPTFTVMPRSLNRLRKASSRAQSKSRSDQYLFVIDRDGDFFLLTPLTLS